MFLGRHASVEFNKHLENQKKLSVSKQKYVLDYPVVHTNITMPQVLRKIVWQQKKG